MKKFVLLAGVVFVVSTLFGCGKKADDATSLDGLTGVVSENVVSVMEPGLTDNQAGDVPVVVDNADSYGAPAEGLESAATPTELPSTKQIQQALKNAGLYIGKIDGDLGPRTKRAIEAFQSQNGLKVDGKVGIKTWRALAGSLNKSTEVANPSDDVQSVTQ